MASDWPDNFHQSDHPLVLHKLSYLRQSDGITHFREYESLIFELGVILGYEVTRTGLMFKDIDMEADSSGRLSPKPPRIVNGEEQFWRTGKSIVNRPVIVPTIRSGLLLANAMRSIIPTPFMGHIALADDEEGNPFEYMVILPESKSADQDFIIADLFIDRGRTARRAIEVLHEYDVSPERIKFVCLIISQEGRDELMKLPYINEIQFFSALLDAPVGDANHWLSDFHSTNHRLFRTKNRDRAEEKH